MEKITYKLLKQLYRVDRLDAEQIKTITGEQGDVSGNQYLLYLRNADYVYEFAVGGKVENGKIIDGTQVWRITLDGRDYIEKRRKELCMFWIPYLITTLIAAAALAAQILPLLVSAGSA